MMTVASCKNKAQQYLYPNFLCFCVGVGSRKTLKLLTSLCWATSGGRRQKFKPGGFSAVINWPKVTLVNCISGSGRAGGVRPDLDSVLTTSA